MTRRTLPLFPSMPRPTLWVRVLPALLAVALLTACGTFRAPGERAMSFAEMQSLNAGVSANWILQEHPFPSGVRRHANGQVAELNYLVEDPLDDSQSLSLLFDTRGVMVQKRYGGPWVRPPEEADETEPATDAEG